MMALFRLIRNSTDHGLIIALRENTDYMINVQAVNTAGNGPKSETYRTRTLRAGELKKNINSLSSFQAKLVKPVTEEHKVYRFHCMYCNL